MIGLLVSSLSHGAEPPVVAKPLAPLPTLDARLDELTSLLMRLEAQVNNKGWLGMLNQVESLKNEVARLRGAQEEMDHALQLAEKRQREVLADFDSQLKELRELAKRPVPVAAVAADSARAASVARAAPPSDPEAETKAYEAALNRFKAADYAGAVAAFNDFLARHPDSSLAGNACYWLGLTYFSMADHKSAAATQKRLLREYPQHAKVPDAKLNLARAQIQLGETENARQELEQVIAIYPASRSAELAKKILALFK